jgi:hypothetical protein
MTQNSYEENRLTRKPGGFCRHAPDGAHFHYFPL